MDGSGVDAHRDRIDSIDDALLKLLSERVRVAIELGRIKRHLGQPIRCMERENFVIERAARLSEGVLDTSAVSRLFRAIIDETRASEECHAITPQ